MLELQSKSETKLEKWTPGPWEYRLNSMGYIWWVIKLRKGDKPLHVAEVMGSTREADARLIAAAPRMAELLHEFAEHFQGTDSPLGIEASALLAEIEGQACKES